MTECVARSRYRAVLAYDGSAYFGFQRQSGDTPTIQGAVETAITRVTGQTITLLGAGRTDTGVHATGQVIAFDVEWRHTPQNLWRALNANLPGDIALQTLEAVTADFHPRFDAQSRAYEYTLYCAPVRQPLLDHYAWHIRHTLNFDAMQCAAHSLVGTADFGTFGQPPQGENTIREVMRSAFEAVPGTAPNVELIRYHIQANAFLYRMVRRIVGALLRVGGGSLTLDEFKAAVRAADSTWPNQTAPACGLCLTKVTY